MLNLPSLLNPLFSCRWLIRTHSSLPFFVIWYSLWLSMKYLSLDIKQSLIANKLLSTRLLCDFIEDSLSIQINIIWDQIQGLSRLVPDYWFWIYHKKTSLMEIYRITSKPKYNLFCHFFILLTSWVCSILQHSALDVILCWGFVLSVLEDDGIA